MAKITKAKFLAAMEAMGVEIEIDDLRRHGSTLNIHAYAPSGKKFRAVGTHNMGLWDNYTDGADWPIIASDIGYPDNVLEDCDDPECDVCHPEEDEE